jgi:hypothetical protein
MTKQAIERKATGIRFASVQDEAAFFGWLQKLPCVSGVQGKGDTLHIRVVSSKVDETALRELLALFNRYSIDMKQLLVFDKEEFSHWLHDKQAYWYKSVFK